MLDSIRSAIVPIHREGYRFVALFLAATLVLYYLGFTALALVGAVLTIWCGYFFRDPERVTPLREGLVIAPADGRISAVSDVAPPAELDLGSGVRQRISIFMNVFDVHINRSPVDGRIARIAYVPGKFLNAELDKASDDNERQALTFEMAGGQRIGVVQIAGLVARRIVKFVKRGGWAAGRPALWYHSLRQPGRCLSSSGQGSARCRGSAGDCGRDRARGPVLDGTRASGTA